MTAVNHLAEKLGVSFHYDKKFSGYYGITQVDGVEVVLLKPKLAMNINGRSVNKVGKLQVKFHILIGNASPLTFRNAPPSF